MGGNAGLGAAGTRCGLKGDDLLTCKVWSRWAPQASVLCRARSTACMQSVANGLSMARILQVKAPGIDVRAEDEQQADVGNCVVL